MVIIQAVRLTFASVLRVIHIALWMTIPTVFWLWLLLAETPADCVPKFAGYEGNALCISDIAFLLIVFGMFLLGFLSIACWICGYSFDIVSRTLLGDKRLPPLRMMSAVEGCGLVCMSLKIWLPAIAYLIVITVLASTLPLATRNHSYHALLLIGAPVLLAMYWGYLIGLARYAVSGEHTLLYRRRENMRLALTNINATLVLTVLLFLVTRLGAAMWTRIADLLASRDDLDLIVEAALGSFGFYMALISCVVACSHLIARYANQIGIGDYHNCDTKPGRPRWT